MNFTHARLLLVCLLLTHVMSAAVISQSVSGPLYACGDDRSCQFDFAHTFEPFNAALGNFESMQITFHAWGTAGAIAGTGPWLSGPFDSADPYPYDSVGFGVRMLILSQATGFIWGGESIDIPVTREGSDSFGSTPVSWTLTHLSSTPPPLDPPFEIDLRMIGYDGLGMWGHSAIDGNFRLTVDYEYTPASSDPVVVPEPGSLTLLSAGAVGACLFAPYWRKRFRRTS